jgi:DNA-binding transcriptional LysR family regulator
MIDLFRFVIAVDQFRNFHLAAKALGLTQSTLSRRIQELEDDLGVRLFNRSRGLEPTEYGRLVISRAGGIVADVQGLKQTLNQMRGLEKGKLSIAVGALVAQSWVGDAVARVVGRYPRLDVQVSQREWWELTTALREREADIAVGQLNEAGREPDVMFEPLPRRQGVFCCRDGHPLAKRKKVSLDEMCAFPLAAPRLAASLAAVLPTGSQFGEIEGNLRYFVPRICVSSFHTALRIVAQTDAIGITFSSFIGREVEEGSLVVLPFKPSWAVSDYGIISLRGRTLPPSAAAFRAAAISAESSYFSKDK